MSGSRNSWWARALLTAMIVAGVLTPLIAVPQNSDQAEVLFQSARSKELVSGELEQAIDLYKKIVAKYGSDRPLAAKALLQMGQCYEKLGNDEARKAYERLVRDYADQNEVAEQARTRLAALRKPTGIPKEPAFATRQVWTGPDVDMEGAPSPDGRYLAFVDWDTGDLAIRDLETGTNRRLTNKGAWEKSEEFAEFSRWSPDGKLIAYDWYDGKCCVGLRVIAREGGEPRTLLENEDGEWMRTYDWSPDGKQILIYRDQANGPGQIMLVSAADGATKVLKTGSWPETMGFSRDGQYIAYDQPQEENAPEHDIFLISVDGSKEVPLVKHPAHDVLLGWPPGGKGILFASDRTGSLDMWFLPVVGGKPQGAPELVKGGVEEIVPMGFTQNGSFYYAQGEWMLDVYVAKVDPKSGKILAPPEKAIKRFEGRNSWPEYSPDGKYLAYLTTRSRAFQAPVHPNIVSIRSLETGKEREFTTKFRRLAGPRWSPDGQSIYVAAWDYEGMGIYRVNAQNGEFTLMVRADPPASLHDHEISPDGNLFIYERRDNPKESPRILSRNLTTGEEKQLYAGNPKSGPLYASLSPDGRRLAFINQDKRKVLQVMPASGGEPKELLRFDEDRPYFASIEWTADGKYILFPRLQPTKDKQRFALWRIPAEGGKPEELGLVMAEFENLSAHPDGEHLTFSSPGLVRKFATIWVMENFLPPAESSRASR
jgi:Tol biopolymer transport system component